MKRLYILLLLAILVFPAFAQNETDEMPTTWEEFYERGKYYREHSNSFRAMQYLEQAEQLHSSDTIRRELALTYFNRGHFQKCIDLCRSVLYPDTLDSDLYLMARSFEKMEKADSALNYQIMVAERNIENYNNLASLCNTLINAGMHNDALEWIDEYCAIDSTNSTINTVKAFALHKADRHKEAIVEYEKLKAEGDDRSSTNFYLGLSYYRTRNVADAYDLLRRAVEQTGRENTAILSRFGVVELALGAGNLPFAGQKRSEGGLREDSYLRPFVEGVEHKNWQDRLKLIEEINQQGLTDIEEAIEKMQPSKDMLFYLYNNIGSHFAAQHEVDKAIPYFNKALTVFKRYNIYYQLAYCYHELKDYKNEMKHYELYLQYAPENEDPDTKEYAKECIEECKKVLFMKGGQ